MKSGSVDPAVCGNVDAATALFHSLSDATRLAILRRLAVVAVVVAQQGATLDPAKLAAALAHVLAKFKQPKHIAVVADLPRNTMGKVQKNLLRNDYKSLFA